MAEEEKNITETISTEEEARLINVSKNRVAFKVHLTIFLLVNLIMWVLRFTLFNTIVTSENINSAILKVFICITLVWFLIVLLHYFIAYRWNKTLVEKQLNKLKKQREKQLKEIEKVKAKIAEAKNKQTEENQ